MLENSIRLKYDSIKAKKKTKTKPSTCEQKGISRSLPIRAKLENENQNNNYSLMSGDSNDLKNIFLVL